MPISKVDFAEVLRSLPLDITPEVVHKAVQQFQAGTPLDKLWQTVNKPLVGSADALIPALRHAHGADESGLRKGAEDLGASLTSPLNIASIGTGIGASLAGKAGKLGISNVARLAEGALQLPMAAEGIGNVVNGDNDGARIGGALEAGLALHGVNAAEKRLVSPSASLVEGVKAQPGTALTGDELALKGSIEPDAISHTFASGASPNPQLSAASQIQLSPELLADVNSRHLANGGSTTDLKTGKGLSAHDARFMLSPYEDRQAILDHPPTEQDLRNFTSRNEDLLSQPGHNLGTWDNQGKHYLDVSIGENDPQKALSLAAKHKQLAIFDLLEGKDVQVPQPASVPQALQIRLDAVVKRGGPVRVNVRKLIAASVKDPQERKSIEDSYLHHLVSSR